MTLILTDDLIVGEGRDRVCYRHPQVETLCIKVPKKPEKQTRRERLYFGIIKYLEKNTEHLSVYRGMVKTNLGDGAMFDLILNEDGNVSSTLTEAIRNDQISKTELNSLLQVLRYYLDSSAICLRDLSPNNIALQIAPDGKKLMIIDGVSNPGINPINFFSSNLIRKNTTKRWNSLYKKIENNYLHLKITEEQK